MSSVPWLGRRTSCVAGLALGATTRGGIVGRREVGVDSGPVSVLWSLNVRASTGVFEAAVFVGTRRVTAGKDATVDEGAGRRAVVTLVANTGAPVVWGLGFVDTSVGGTASMGEREGVFGVEHALTASMSFRNGKLSVSALCFTSAGGSAAALGFPRLEV